MSEILFAYLMQNISKSWASTPFVYAFHLLNISFIHNLLIINTYQKIKFTPVYTLSIKILLIFTFFAFTLS